MLIHVYSFKLTEQINEHERIHIHLINYLVCVRSFMFVKMINERTFTNIKNMNEHQYSNKKIVKHDFKASNILTLLTFNKSLSYKYESLLKTLLSLSSVV